MAIKDIVGRLEDALENLITLEVVTAVGTVQPSTRDDKGNRKPIALDAGAKILRTRINLLQGDITMEMDPAFVTGDLKEVRAVHADREKQAADIVRSNIEALKSLVVFIESRTEKKS